MDQFSKDIRREIYNRLFQLEEFTRFVNLMTPGFAALVTSLARYEAHVLARAGIGGRIPAPDRSILGVIRDMFHQGIDQATITNRIDVQYIFPLVTSYELVSDPDVAQSLERYYTQFVRVAIDGLVGMVIRFSGPGGVARRRRRRR